MYYILIGNFLLPQAGSPSGRYSGELSQKQGAMEKPGCALVCGGSTGVPVVPWSWGGCSDKPWSNCILAVEEASAVLAWRELSSERGNLFQKFSRDYYHCHCVKCRDSLCMDMKLYKSIAN